MSNKKFDDRYRLDVMNEQRPDELDWLEYGNDIAGDPESQRLLDEEYDALTADRAHVRQINARRKDEETMQLPLNVVRMIETAKKLFNVEDFQRSDLRPQDVVPTVQSMLDRMQHGPWP